MARGSHSSPQRTKKGKSRKSVLKSLKRLISNNEIISKNK